MYILDQSFLSIIMFLLLFCNSDMYNFLYNMCTWKYAVCFCTLRACVCLDYVESFELNS